MAKADKHITEETKATGQHQITIPLKIWQALNLKPGIRFQMVFKGNDEITLRPKRGDLELNDGEWRELTKLARSEKNVSKRFRKSKDAIDHINSL
jgi:bifunctional DNA-binding transcriptional regulator/antitoxin component of YhaV-PrlF toxin-antitoxin module